MTQYVRAVFDKSLYQLPLKIRRVAEAFAIEDAGGMALAYVYFDDRRDVTHLARRPTMAGAKEIAQQIARALTAAAEGARQ